MKVELQRHSERETVITRAMVLVAMVTDTDASDDHNDNSNNVGNVVFVSTMKLSSLHEVGRAALDVLGLSAQQDWHRIMKLASSKAAVLGTAVVALYIHKETPMHLASIL